ncbi:MAG: TIM44-like domain-containing protein, partial [Desulfofustis sp.]|nr:TIM44-like domain-containing protein [Desulfofustis sp.]
MMSVRILMIMLALAFVSPLVGSVSFPESAEARSFKGGRMFKPSTPAYKAPSQKQQPGTSQQQAAPARTGGLGRGLAGGLLGGAMGALLFGSLFGMGGNGIGLLPILLLAGVAFFVYRTYTRSQSMRQAAAGSTSYGSSRVNTDFEIGGGAASASSPPIIDPVQDGLEQIRRGDPGFDEAYFLEVASDVFFQIQAGWAGRDLTTYRHLLGDQLAAEYEHHFDEMRAAGRINKLDNVAVRSVEIAAAGSRDGEDFVTVLFTATLLDYTIDEQSGEVVDG